MYFNVKKGINLIIFLLVSNIIHAQVENSPEQTDSLSQGEQVATDSVRLDSVQINKEKLEDIVSYDSEDQVHEIQKKMTFLLRKAHVVYQDFDLTADYIEINWDTGDVYAEGKKDSLGVYIEPTIFKQGNSEFSQEAFKFNFNSQVGVAFNTRTSEGEGTISAIKVKRVNDSISLLRGVDYTTDSYYRENKTKDPDYVLRADKAKIIDRGENKTLIVGPAHMRIEDVPTPLAVPFAFLPIGGSPNGNAGLILPSFGEREDVGFFLQGLGLYVPFGDYVDLKLSADAYTRGSWGVHVESNYAKRYRFNGSLLFDYENLLNGIRGLESFTRQRNFRLNWSHRQDPKANPNLVFSANVNYSSSQFFRNTINNTNIINGLAITNTISSSISINKTFENTPFTMALTLNHSQNNNTQSDEPAPVNFTLPQLTLNMRRIYPFAPKNGSKKGLLQNIAVDYNLNVQNNINTDEDRAFTSEMFDDARYGARHRANIQTGFTLGNYFPVNLSSNYTEVWYPESTLRFFDDTEGVQQVVDEEVAGFSAFRTFGFAAGVQTNLYGIWNSKKENAKIKAIRHVISPSINFSYTPDFAARRWGYYDTYRGQDGNQVLYNRFVNGVFGGPGQGESATIGIGINNNIEMKVRSKNDSINGGYEKVKIFDFLSINTGYNLVADSLNLSPISFRGSTAILKDKMRINFSGSFDPYRLAFDGPDDNTGTRINSLATPRLTNYQINMSYSLNPETLGLEYDASRYTGKGLVRYEVYDFDEFGYAHFNVPWNVSMNLNHTWTRGNNRDATRLLTLGLDGSIEPSPYWRITASTSYDFNSQDFAFTRFSFTRDLRSFNVRFSWVPFGTFKTYDFFIGIRASILSDALKYEEDSPRQLNTVFP